MAVLRPLKREEVCNVGVAAVFVSPSKHFPIDIIPYLPTSEFPRGKNDSRFKDKIQIALELFDSYLLSFWAGGIRMTTTATTSLLPTNSTLLPKWLLRTICSVGGLNTVSRNSKILFTLTTTRSGISTKLIDTGISALLPGLLGSTKILIYHIRSDCNVVQW